MVRALGRLAHAAAVLLAMTVASAAQMPAPGAPGDADVFIAGAASNRIDILLHFLDRGLDPDTIGRDGSTALIAAARESSESAVKLLLARGANPDRANAEDWTPLMEACYRDRATIVKLLIDAGAKVDRVESRNGKTALMVAAQGRDVDIVASLLDGGAAIDARDAVHGRTALVRAIANRSDEGVAIATELVVRGADPDVADRDGGTALMLAAEGGDIRRIGLLIEAGADPDTLAGDGRSALGLAARHGFADLVRHLLARGASADPGAGLAPLAEAAASGNRAIVEQLLDANARIDGAGRAGRTALVVAATDVHDDIVELLLERGAAVNAINGIDGTTALMWAANGGWVSVVRRLLAAGARPSIVARDGWTAAEAARMAGHDDIVKLLEEGI